MPEAVFAGSFNPWHVGHTNVLLQALKVFDNVIVLVARNPDKTDVAAVVADDQSLQEYINAQLRPYGESIQVRSTSGFVVDFCSDHDILYMIRGIRDGKDLEYERRIESVNRYLDSRIQTVYFLAPDHLKEVSSTSIREARK